MIEPKNDIMVVIISASSKGSYESDLMRSLVRAFTTHTYNVGALVESVQNENTGLTRLMYMFGRIDM